MSMTLDEMKLAICERLPELIKLEPKGKADFGGGYPAYNAWQKTGLKINWPTEGLQVCHKAEKLLIPKEEELYVHILSGTIMNTAYEQDPRYMHSHLSSSDSTYRCTYEQRLEALCRVWFPERWKD